MAPKKRKSQANGDTLQAPDRETWLGWVEMESEPAFFNVMLKEMGAHGVKIQEVYGLEDEMLAVLQQPVHALIFLFRYGKSDEEHHNAGIPQEHIWFANQIPDFACASVALLNIVNNIDGLALGKELHDFRALTREMDPVERGVAIDDFDFIRRIHNSFAREIDLLNADMHCKSRFDRHKRLQAAAKGRATKEAQKVGRAKMNSGSSDATDNAIEPRSELPVKDQPVLDRSVEITGSDDPPLAKRVRLTAKQNENEQDYNAKTKGYPDPPVAPRRSERKSKPLRNPNTLGSAFTTTTDESDDEGFHFIAYMPIAGHVWKLDGLDRYPQDLGAIDTSAPASPNLIPDWMALVQPTIATRMAQLGDADVSFNLMAVVHDPLPTDRQQLESKLRTIQSVTTQLDLRSKTSNPSHKPPNHTTALNPARTPDDLDLENMDTTPLIHLRDTLEQNLPPLRARIRDAVLAATDDQEKARHRRFAYSPFVRGWLTALAEREVLSELIDGTVASPP